ncbi:hypothetical protein K2173_019105 [Erythroxylum novogranatense]|uniref:(+)-neomenthol dehydrogenase n=1 Tax=Erythroxylum novogranatense TaxID=1862640 RepID=A0AAV8SSN3_9ROSI|nr:hypothetical protein K2173_019105 [Erythroxylum novogranatense]
MDIKECPNLSAPSLSSSTRWWSKDTVAVVTGANKGIGFSMVKKLAELGLTVILTARDTERGRKAVDELRRQHGLHVYFHRLDVSDSVSIKAFVDWLRQNLGVLDILVNNAGVSFNGLHENSVGHAETVIKTNFCGAKLLTESLLPLFRNSASKGRIVNISSRLGSFDKMRNPKMRKMLESETLTVEQIEEIVNLFLENVKKGTWKSQGWPEYWTDYAVSKMALNAYSQVLARRYQDNGRLLTIICFCPGFTQTSMTGGKGTYTADYAGEAGVRLALLPPEDLSIGTFHKLTHTGIKSKM